MQQNQLMIQSHTAMEDSNNCIFQKGLDAEKPSMVSHIVAISDLSMSESTLMLYVLDLTKCWEIWNNV